MKARMRLLSLAASVLAGSLVLTACGGTHDMADMGMGSPSGTTGASAADAMFAQMMIPHHEQAVEMSTLAETRASSPEITELAARIKSAQQPEIDQMTAWLEEWGLPVMPGMDAMAEHGGHGMSGMLTEEQLADLEAASGPAFDRLFAEFMIEHHEGAIDMAEDVVDSRDPRVATLAQAILTTQAEEIAQMEAFLEGPANAAEGDASASLSAIELSTSLDHVHAAVMVGDSVLVGTHAGVVEIDPQTGVSVPRGESRDDFMGLAGDDRGLIASGHPGEGSSLPDPIGLIRSADGGSTWQPVSLTGAVDFHALAIDGDRIAGASTSGDLLYSEDAGMTWMTMGTTDALSLAWFDGRLWIAENVGAVSWTPGLEPRDTGLGTVLQFARAADGAVLWALLADGTIQRSADGVTWSQQGSVDEAGVLAATAETAYLVTPSDVYVVPAKT